MKKNIFTLSLCLSVLFSLVAFPIFSETLTADDLEERDGLYYKKFTDSLFSGEAILLHEKYEGVTEKGTIHAGKKVGAWTSYDGKHPYEHGKYKNNQKVGVWLSIHYNGQLETKGEYINGKKIGLWKSFHQNGQQKRIGNYKEGNKHGLWEIFYESGQLMTRETYINGLMHGLWERFNSKGELVAQQIYLNDEPYGPFLE